VRVRGRGGREGAIQSETQDNSYQNKYLSGGRGHGF
jgi:hypothetical protein